MTVGIPEYIRELESQIGNPKEGLPEAIFQFASRLTPLVNVDLLIRNTLGQVLLTWRDDEIFGRGWHVPGGCIRLGETFADRISAVANSELGVSVTANPNPIGIYETVDNTRTSRTHHITFLFDCQLDSEPASVDRHTRGQPKSGSWAWHAKRPRRLLQTKYQTWFPTPIAYPDRRTS